MKRVMFDTNVIISALLSGKGNPSRSIELASEQGYDLCICQEIRDEVVEKFRQKWPHLLAVCRQFLTDADFVDVETPSIADKHESSLRDEDDRPIYRAAKAAGVSYLITGDKDLLDFEQDSIRVITVTDFIQTLYSC